MRPYRLCARSPTRARGATFDTLPIGARFELACAEQREHPLVRPIHVDSHEGEFAAELRDGTAAALELVLHDERGRLRPHHPVVLREGDLLGRRLATAETDADGRVLFAGLAGGAYAVQVPSGAGADVVLVAGQVARESAALR